MTATGEVLLLLLGKAEAPAQWVQDLKQWENGLKIQTYRFDIPADVLEAYELIIVDFEGAEISQDALDFCNRLRLQTTCPILLLTNDTNETRLLQAYKAGIDDCIAKPIGTDLLVAKANAWLNFSR